MTTIYQVRNEARTDDPADNGSLMKEFKTFAEASEYAEAENARTGDNSIFISPKEIIMAKKKAMEKKVLLWVTDQQHEWLMSKQNASELIRNLVQTAMDLDNPIVKVGNAHHD